jgi:hypothetical protein
MSNDSMDLPAPPEWPDWKSDPLVIHPVRMKGAETFSIPSPAIEGAREPANNSRIKPEALQTLQAALDRQLEEVERDFNAGKIDAATYLARTRRLREANVAFFVTALAAPFTDLLARLQVAFNTSDIAPGTM